MIDNIILFIDEIFKKNAVHIFASMISIDTNSVII